jgi:hypothetical protein
MWRDMDEHRFRLSSNIMKQKCEWRGSNQSSSGYDKQQCETRYKLGKYDTEWWATDIKARLGSNFRKGIATCRET